MIDLAERCATALKEHAQPAFTAQCEEIKHDLADQSPVIVARALQQVADDRVRYFEEIERELVKVLAPVQRILDTVDAAALEHMVCERETEVLGRVIEGAFQKLNGDAMPKGTKPA